jgi:hypothetical protein
MHKIIVNITLSQVLGLVGKLDDTPGEDTPRERLRRFLEENIKDVGSLRDYIEECLRNSGEQYSYALQDLVNHLGTFLEFKVTFGRYRGVHSEIGFDGHWRSPTGFHIVVEVKRSEVYPIRTDTLVNYINNLISERKIPDEDHALGLYVIGRADPSVKQLENSIIAEKRERQLRVISVEALLLLAELKSQFDIPHEDILNILRPSTPSLDPLIDTMMRLASASPIEVTETVIEEKVPESGKEEVNYFLAPVNGNETRSPEEVVRDLVGEKKIWGFGEKTPYRELLKPSDKICFYASGKGVIAHAEIATKPRKVEKPDIEELREYPWVFQLKNVKLYLDEPVSLDANLRSQLDAFKNKDQSTWGWFVHRTQKITKHDFELLTRG